MNTLKLVAILEFAKGLIILLSAMAIYVASNEKVLSLLPAYIQHIYLPSIAIFIYRKVSSFIHGDFSREYFLYCFAFSYSTLRFLEAYGLWKMKTWGYLIGIISAALYLPIEFYEILNGFAWYKVLITALNIVIILYLIRSKPINNS